MQCGAPFDAVIMDLTVPGGMGGEEAIRNLLNIDPHVTAIVSSGYSKDRLMANYKEHGFKAVLVKPFRMEEIGCLLDGVLAESRRHNGSGAWDGGLYSPVSKPERKEIHA
jgi:CheY-like chemotaxis protein